MSPIAYFVFVVLLHYGNCLWNALTGLPNGSVIVLCSTVSPAYVQKLGKSLTGKSEIS